jgi:acyl dehydratase
MTIDTKFIGKIYPETHYEIGREKVKEFIRATKGEQFLYTETLPLTFPVVYASALLEAVLYDPDLNLNLKKLVHGDQEFIYHQTAKIGDTLTSRGFIENIFAKKGHDFVVFKVESYSEHQELVCTQKMTFVVRGGNDKDFSISEKLALKLAGIAAKLNPIEKVIPAEESQPLYSQTSETEYQMNILIDKYMPQRYAGASGDFNAIHLDDTLGKNSGLGGYILHGMATMALAANLGVHFFGTTSIKSFKARFSKPVSPGDELSYFAKLIQNDTEKKLEINAKDTLGNSVLEFGYLDFC